MLAKSLKSHSCNTDSHDDVPRAISCFDGRTWQQTRSTDDSVGIALPSEPEMNWCPSSAVCSLGFVLFLGDVNPPVVIKLSRITFSKGKLVFLLLLFCKFNIKRANHGCLFTELVGEINHLCSLHSSVKFGHN